VKPDDHLVEITAAALCNNDNHGATWDRVRYATADRYRRLASRALAAVLPEHERQVRAKVAAEILSLWPPDDTDDDALVQSIGAYLRGICHVCEEPLTAEPCTPRHGNLARGEWKRGGA
jgi:hypothetical protein